ncbi:MAG: hypothetical protein HMLIMOIP_001432 [Candidatus Nitrosomirales archaeon]
MFAPPTPADGSTLPVLRGEALTFIVKCSDTDQNDIISLDFSGPSDPDLTLELIPNMPEGNPAEGIFFLGVEPVLDPSDPKQPDFLQTKTVTFTCEDDHGSSTQHSVDVAILNPAKCNTLTDETERNECHRDVAVNIVNQALLPALGLGGFACLGDVLGKLGKIGSANDLNLADLNGFVNTFEDCAGKSLGIDLEAFKLEHPTILSLHALTNPSSQLPANMPVFKVFKGIAPRDGSGCNDPSVCFLIHEVKGSELDNYKTPWKIKYDFLEWVGKQPPGPLAYSVFTNGNFTEDNIGDEHGKRHYLARERVDQNVIPNKIMFPRNVHAWFLLPDKENTCPKGEEDKCPRWIDISQIWWVTYDVLNQLDLNHELFDRSGALITRLEDGILYKPPYDTLTLDSTFFLRQEIKNRLFPNYEVTANGIFANFINIDVNGDGLIEDARFKLNCVQRPNNPSCIPASGESISMNQPRKITFRWDLVGSADPNAPDLAIENLTVFPSSPEQGEPTRINFTIKNLGQTSAICQFTPTPPCPPNGNLELLLSGSPVPGAQPQSLDYTLEPFSLNNKQEDYSVDWDTSKPSVGTYQLEVRIPEAKPLERLFSNNEMAVTVDIKPPTRPDLIISDFDFTPKDPQGVIAGQNYMFRITVSNISPVAASNVKVLFGIDPLTCPTPPAMPNKIGEITINTLKGNDFKSVDFVWDTTNFAPDVYCATFVVDPSQSIPELNDDNNRLLGKGKDDIPIRVRAGSPLPCATLSTDKKIYNPGENVALNFANNCPDAIKLPNSDPWLVKDSGVFPKNIVFEKEPFLAQPINVSSHSTIGWGWGQIDQNLNQVRADQYKIELETTNASIYTTSFTILPAECAGKRFPNVIIGTGLSDVLIGTDIADLIVGLDGNDTIKGRAGGDCLIGGSGLDTLKGGGGSDVLIGGLDGDTVLGNGGNDIMIIDSCDFSRDGGIDEMRGGKGTNDKLVLGIGLNQTHVNGSVPAFEVLDPCDGIYFIRSTEKIVDT